MTEPGAVRHAEHTMGTVFSFDIRGAPTRAVTRALADAVAWLHRVDEVFSTYRPGSQISRLGRGELTEQQCDPEVAEVLELCRAAARSSNGWFSATPGGRLDPSAVVKGWAVERASQLLYDAGARHHSVNGGGDIQTRGEAAPGLPWQIGIAHPLCPGDLTTVVTGRDLAVATSGTAERGPHILDLHTGRLLPRTLRRSRWSAATSPRWTRSPRPPSPWATPLVSGCGRWTGSRPSRSPRTHRRGGHPTSPHTGGVRQDHEPAHPTRLITA